MADPNFSTQISGTDALLDEFIQEVQAKEGNLSGGKKIQPGVKALQDWRATQVSLGSPLNQLVHLTPQLFSDLGLQLDPVTRHQLDQQFDFYYMPLSISLVPAGGVEFGQLACRLDFGPKGKSEPIVHTIFPTSAWKEVLSWGGSLKLGLDAGLKWQAGVNLSAELLKKISKLPPELKAQVVNENEMKSFIAMPAFSFQLGRAELVATGEGNSFCYWEITQPSLKKQQTVTVGAVFKVPQGTRQITLTGIAEAQPSFPWLTAELSNVIKLLSQKWKDLLNKPDPERTAAERLLRNPAERWKLDLPA